MYTAVCIEHVHKYSETMCHMSCTTGTYNFGWFEPRILVEQYEPRVLLLDDVIRTAVYTSIYRYLNLCSRRSLSHYR